MTDQVSTVIEDIPVELWHEIFQYVDLHGLCVSFRRLNGRIDAILDQIPLDLSFRRRGAYGEYARNIHRFIDVENVRSLRLQQPNDIRLFFSIHQLSSFVRLRSLHLLWMFSVDDPTFQFWNQLSSLKYLESLRVSFSKSSSRCTSTDQKKYLICSVFVRGLFPGLQRFSVDAGSTYGGAIAIPSLNPMTKAMKLQYLTIDRLTFNDLMILLPAIENILSLRIDGDLEKDEKLMGKLPEIDRPLLYKCLHLKLKLDDSLTFEHVEYLLGQTPNLKSLFLWGWSHLTDPKKWQWVLLKYCPQLLKLELICTGHIYDEIFYNAGNHFEQECRTNPFWLRRKTATNDSDRSSRDYCADFTVQFDIRKKWTRTLVRSSVTHENVHMENSVYFVWFGRRVERYHSAWWIVRDTQRLTIILTLTPYENTTTAGESMIKN